jgi:uncharacterized membrane protein YqjE
MYTQTSTSYRQDQRSLSDLFADLSQKAGLLVRQEVQLAKVEMREKATEYGREIAWIAIGAVLANAALLALVAAVILGLSEFMEPWLAALLVAGAVAIIAALLVGKGLSALKEMNPVPERTVATIKEDKEWLAQQLS